MNARPDRYTYPPRASMVTPITDKTTIDQIATAGWIAQYKFNDTRLLLKYLPDGQIQLWNRHAKQIDYTPTPELAAQLQQLPTLIDAQPGTYNLLDGGLLYNKHTQGPKNVIVLWDWLIKDGQHRHGTTYNERWTELHRRAGAEYTYPAGTTVAHALTTNIIVPDSHPGPNWANMWDALLLENAPHHQPLIEGLVFKNSNGQLTPGTREQNNGDWMIRSRVTTGRHLF